MESGALNTTQRGRVMGLGTPSVAPEQAKEAVPRPTQRVETPPRSRSAERSGAASTPRTDTPPGSRSTERSDGRDCGNTPILQPTPIVPATVGWLDAPRSRSLDRDATRQPPATTEGLGPIVIGGDGRSAPDSPQEPEPRASSFNQLRRALTAITGLGRSPQPPPPRRGRSPNRMEREGSASRGGSEDHTDTSSYGSDVRAEQSPQAYQGRRIALSTSGRGRTDIPTPPLFIDEVFMAGVQAGAAIQSAQNMHWMGDGGNIGRASSQREENQPQGEPEPELPGAEAITGYGW